VLVLLLLARCRREVEEIHLDGFLESGGLNVGGLKGGSLENCFGPLGRVLENVVVVVWSFERICLWCSGGSDKILYNPSGKA
jgi:hypothetical protein